MSLKIVLTKKELKDLTRKYESGKSIKFLSENLNIGRPAITRILKCEGTKIRGRSEAEKKKWVETKKDHKKVIRQCGKAWVAATDRKQGDDEKVARAQTRFSRQSQIHKGERAVAVELRKAGFQVEQQFPEFIYNLDIAIPSAKIAVEIVGSNWKPHQADFYYKRTRLLLENGWVVVNAFTWCKEAGLLRLQNPDNTFARAIRTLPTFMPERIAEYICKLKLRIERGEEIHGKYVIISGNANILSAPYKKAMFFNGLPCLTDSHGHSFGLIPQKYEKLKRFLR